MDKPLCEPMFDMTDSWRKEFELIVARIIGTDDNWNRFKEIYFSKFLVDSPSGQEPSATSTPVRFHQKEARVEYAAEAWESDENNKEREFETIVNKF